MKVSPILKGKPDAFNRYAVYIRTNDGEKRTFKVTKYRLKTEQLQKGKVVNHPSADVINKALEVMIFKTEIGEDKPVKDGDFFKYVDQFTNEVDKERSYETLRQYRAESTKLKSFRTSAKLSSIDPEFLKKYAQHCYSIGNEPNTVWKTFKFLRMIIRRAIKEKMIAENPFDHFQMPKYKDPKKTYLTKTQVEKLLEYIPENEGAKRVGTWFIIGCYTGLRYGDMITFNKKKNIKNNRLVFYTNKTDEVVSMPVSAKVKDLLESIHYEPLNMPNNHCNDILRGIIAQAGIDEAVTWHSSRHTFATMCAEAGISQEVTAKLLGHRSIKTTAIYYKITNPRIDAEIARLG
jgi:integrase/recombinase XerD